MAVPANWSMVRIVGQLTDDDNDPLTGYTIETISSAPRLQDSVSHRVMFPEKNTVTPAVSDGYFFWDQLSDTDTDVKPTGRQTKVTLLKDNTPVQSWWVTVDHALAVQMRFDNQGGIVTTGGTLMDAVWLTSLEDFSAAPIPGGQTAGAAIIALKAEPDPFPQYATNDELAAIASAGLVEVAVKTGAYTAASLQLVPADTTGGTFPITLPAATAGREVAIRWEAGAVPPTIVAAGTDKIGPGSGTTAAPVVVGQVIHLQVPAAGGRWRSVVTTQTAIDARGDSRYLPIRPLVYDTLSTKTDGAINARATDSGHTWIGTGSATPTVAAGIIGHPAGFTGSGSWYSMTQTPARCVRTRGRFRFDTSDAVGSSVCIGIFDTSNPGAPGGSSPAHCSITPSYVRFSTFLSGIGNEVVLAPVGEPATLPRFPRAIPCDGASWTDVELLLDPDRSTAYVILTPPNDDVQVLRYEHSNIAAIDARYPFMQSFAVSGQDNLGRWDGDSFGADAAPAPGIRSALSNLFTTARSAAGRVLAGAGTAVARHSSRLRAGAQWTVAEQTLATTAATLAARTDPACATTAGSTTVTDAAVVASDAGRTVTGPGVPPGAYVGTVTAGTSFLLSSSPTAQVDLPATATATGVSLTIATDRITCASPLRAGTRVTLDTGAAREVRVTGTPSGSGSTFTIPFTSPLVAAHASGAAILVPPYPTVSDGTTWRDRDGVIVSNRLLQSMATLNDDPGGPTVLTGGTRITVRAPAGAGFRTARVHKVTMTAAVAAPLLYSPAYPAEPGEPIAVVIGQIMAGVSARNVQAAVRFVSAAGAQLGVDILGTAVSAPTSGPVQVPPVTAVAPAGTASAYWLLYGANFAAGDTFFLAEMSLSLAHGPIATYVKN